MTKGKRFRWFAAILVIGFFGVLLGDALGLFKSTPYTAIPHGGHAHYVPDDRDPGVELGQCPTHAPGPDEILSPQCQIVRMVRQGEMVYYVPEQVTPGTPIDRFPTRKPSSGEIIRPDGQITRIQLPETR